MTGWLDPGAPLDGSDYTKSVLTGKLGQIESKQVFKQ